MKDNSEDLYSRTKTHVKLLLVLVIIALTWFLKSNVQNQVSKEQKKLQTKVNSGELIEEINSKNLTWLAGQSEKFVNITNEELVSSSITTRFSLREVKACNFTNEIEKNFIAQPSYNFNISFHKCFSINIEQNISNHLKHYVNQMLVSYYHVCQKSFEPLFEKNFENGFTKILENKKAIQFFRANSYFAFNTNRYNDFVNGMTPLKLTGICKVQNSIDEIKKVIYFHGPVLAFFKLFTDLLSYKQGIYEKHSNKVLEDYYSGILFGWGREEKDGFTKDYWLVKLDFGEKLGEKGVVKIGMDSKNAQLLFTSRVFALSALELEIDEVSNFQREIYDDDDLPISEDLDDAIFEKEKTNTEKTSSSKENQEETKKDNSL